MATSNSVLNQKYKKDRMYLGLLLQNLEKLSCSMKQMLRYLEDLEVYLACLSRDHYVIINEVLATSKDVILRHVSHPEMEIRIAVASCISEILRIIVPDEPFEVEEMKAFFELVNKAFEHLPVMNGRIYEKSKSILKSVSQSHSFRLMLDLEMYDLARKMFQLLLGGIRNEHSDEVCSNMKHIMSVLLTECEDCDDLVIDLTMILLSSLKKETQDATPAAFNLAKKVFGKCADIVTFHILKAIKLSGTPVDQYDDIVGTFCQDATQKGHMDREDRDEPDNVSDKQLKSKPKDSQRLGKRISKPSSLAHPEEGYEYLWMINMGRGKEKRKRSAEEGEHSKSKCNAPKNLSRDVTVTISQPLSRNASLNGEARLGEVRDQHRMIDMIASEEKHSSKGEDLDGDILIKTLTKSKPSSSKRKSRHGDAFQPEDQREPSEQEVYGEGGIELIGSRIKVWWPLDEMFFEGEITFFDPLTKKHQIDYDDGDQEMLELSQELWRFIDENDSLE